MTQQLQFPIHTQEQWKLVYRKTGAGMFTAKILTIAKKKNICQLQDRWTNGGMFINGIRLSHKKEQISDRLNNTSQNIIVSDRSQAHKKYVLEEPMYLKLQNSPN